MRDTMERIKKFLKASGGMGLRIVKTGIAATLCVVVSYWMMLDTPFFAVAATVISMGNPLIFPFAAVKTGCWVL